MKGYLEAVIGFRYLKGGRAHQLLNVRKDGSHHLVEYICQISGGRKVPVVAFFVGEGRDSERRAISQATFLPSLYAHREQPRFHLGMFLDVVAS